jgi:glycosyltransferase involved in cell wall biosynthesis
MNNPLISCLCCTFNRNILLGESIKCFLDQDYGNKELVVVNDQEGVSLRMSPLPDNIQIYNHPKRFDSLGQKRNYLKSLAHGEYFCIWDDDDLYAPFRLSESVYFMEMYPEPDIIKPQDAFISVDNEKYQVATNRFHAQAVIRKSYMDKTQYPLKSIGEDAVFERTANIKLIDMFPSFWAILRWGMKGVYHISQIPSALESESWVNASKSGNIQGEIEIKAEFQKDYWADMYDVFNDITPGLGKEWYKKIGRLK